MIAKKIFSAWKELGPIKEIFLYIPASIGIFIICTKIDAGNIDAVTGEKAAIFLFLLALGIILNASRRAKNYLEL